MIRNELSNLRASGERSPRKIPRVCPAATHVVLNPEEAKVVNTKVLGGQKSPHFTVPSGQDPEEPSDTEQDPACKTPTGPTLASYCSTRS